MIWSFDVTSDRDLTQAEVALMDTIPAIYEGDITPEYGGGQPVIFHCDIAADSYQTAVQDAVAVIRRLGLVPGDAVVPVGELVG